MMANGNYPRPQVRKLYVYAFDPQASTKIDTAALNEAILEIPWETEDEEPLRPGPTNEYLEVIDIDPVSGQFYDPIDLNDPYLLASQGLKPTEGNPQFHQQMVFAVAMKTIRAFERALGRRVLWAPRKVPEGYEPVSRLRVYPHALREPNAYYSKEKIALLFGYFRSSARDAGSNWVFTALSHDVVVHETTHAILDGFHRRYAEPTSVDSLAFHEAFADIVALLLHFTLSEAVHAEITANRGPLDQRSLMTGLARQFGRAIGERGSLREAIDDKIGGEPDPTRLETLTEPHARGAVLVAAVFEAFLTIYQRRTADLMRFAGPELGSSRALHPDLVNRLVREATKSADHVLRMCLRALDYLPPVDVRFGEFLRAIITADNDLVPIDPYGYRLAMIEAFRRRGIVPENCLSLAPDSLLWESDFGELPLRISDFNPKEVDLKRPRKRSGATEIKVDLSRPRTRQAATDISENNRKAMWHWLMESDDNDAEWQRACGVIFRPGLGTGTEPPTVMTWPPEYKVPTGNPKVEVHSVRTTHRTGPDGQDLQQLVIEVAQRRRGFLDKNQQDSQDKPDAIPAKPDFIFRGGATLIFDLDSGKLRYAVRKRVNDDKRLAAQREFLVSQAMGNLGMTYSDDDASREPFAMVHRKGR